MNNIEPSKSKLTMPIIHVGINLSLGSSQIIKIPFLKIENIREVKIFTADI